MKALAIACVRNEEVHVRNLVGGLIRDGLDVILIDHNSTDRTVTIASEFLGNGLLEIRPLPWKGVFSLREQLQEKWACAERGDHDWIVHVDADEWLTSPRDGQRLIEAIREVDNAGYNCIDFNEFVFVPLPGEDLSSEDYRRTSDRYYFYRNAYPFLQRAWKKLAGLDNRPGAGHLLTGDVRMFPEEFIMRHYIVLSEEHALAKFTGRLFDPYEVIDGWHLDRLTAKPENLGFPAAGDPRLHVQSNGTRHQFDTSRPRKQHYWKWDAEAC
jgi:glycosyltransferase involved in cell wall biosynthesis